MSKALLSAFGVGTLTSFWAIADSWLPAVPIVASSPNTELVVRIEPGGRIGPAQAIYFRRMESPDSYSAFQRTNLVNVYRPLEAFIGDAGVLVTLDEYGSPGHQNAIVVYGSDGREIQSYDLDGIYTDSALSSMVTTVSSRHWRETQPYFYDDALRLVDIFENTLDVSLVDGSLKVFAWEPEQFHSDAQISVIDNCKDISDTPCGLHTRDP